MQTLPIITATPPSAPAQATAAMDNNSAQPAEAFGKVLARQRANADAQDQQQAPSSSAASVADGAAEEAQAAAPDLASTLPGDMLAALLPGVAGAANGKTTDEKTSTHKAAPKAAAPDSPAILPGDMLAALAAAPVTTQNAGVGAELQQDTVSATPGGNTQQSGDLARALGQHASPSLSAGQTVELSRPSGAALPAAASSAAASSAADTAKTGTFSAMLGTLGQEAANTALSASETQVAAQAALPDSASLLNQTQGIATTPVAASPNAPAQITLNTPVTQDTWGDEFNQKITWLATQHEQTAQLHLNPPQLGPLDVVLNVSGDQATALFTSPHAAVREALEQALPKLRDMLAENGITLGNAMVSDQSPKEQQQAWQAGQGQKGEANSSGKTGDDLPAAGILAGNANASGRRHQGMVDTFA